MTFSHYLEVIGQNPRELAPERLDVLLGEYLRFHPPASPADLAARAVWRSVTAG